SEDELLPVDQAFVLSASAPEPGRIEVQWKIAEGYYLYRHRTSVTASGDFVGGNLRLPAGERHVDEFFGPVETYRGRLLATRDGQPTGAGAIAELEVRYQGCADLGICYPPQTRRLQVRLPGAGLPPARPAAGRNPLAAALGSAVALPEAQAFSVDAIADGGNSLRVRLQPAAGDYIYRDHTRFALADAPGLTLGRPQWPAGTPHRDEYFGEVTVHFDPAEVAVPVRRTRPQAVRATLVVSFQGCQDGGICYPPMTRRITVDIPAGTVAGSVDESVPATRTPAPAGDDTAAATSAPLPTAPAAGPDPAQPVPDASAGNASRTRAPETQAGPGGLAGVLLLALLGGLVLNLM